MKASLMLLSRFDGCDSGQAFADANLKLEVVELRLSLLLMFMLRNMLATVGADLVTKLKKSDFEHRVRLKKIIPYAA